MFNILIADDEKVVRDLLSRLLKADNVNIFTAENGFKAIEIAKENKPDLVFLDIRMPGNGLKAYQELKIINPDLRCVFITGHALEEMILEKTKPAGVICLKKPFDDVKKIKEITNNIRQEKQSKKEDDKKNIDRRSYIRLGFTLEVDYSLREKSDLSYSSSGGDISPGGIRLFTDEELIPGAKLTMTIKVPRGQEKCPAEGLVIWSKKQVGGDRPYCAGLKFTEVDFSKLSELIIRTC